MTPEEYNAGRNPVIGHQAKSPTPRVRNKLGSLRLDDGGSADR